MQWGGGGSIWTMNLDRGGELDREFGQRDLDREFGQRDFREGPVKRTQRGRGLTKRATPKMTVMTASQMNTLARSPTPSSSESDPEPKDEVT